MKRERRQIDLVLRPEEYPIGKTVCVTADVWPFHLTEAVLTGAHIGFYTKKLRLGLRFAGPLERLPGCFEHGYHGPYASTYVGHIEEMLVMYEGETEITIDADEVTL